MKSYSQKRLRNTQSSVSSRKRLFVVRKYIIASSIQEALGLEKKHKPDEVFLDGEWLTRTHMEIEFPRQNSMKSGSLGFKQT